MIQISMDGPNVNWNVLKILSRYREEKELWDHFLFVFKPVNEWFPFLGTELDITLRKLISLIFRRKHVTDADIPYLFMKVDLENKENFVHLNNVDLDSSVTSVLPKLSLKGEIKIKLRKSFVNITENLMERCILIFSIMRNVVCLSPIEIIHNTEASV